MTHAINRRNFIKVSGAALGGIATGTTVVAAERTDRFIVDLNETSTDRLQRAGLEVVHDLGQIDIAVVEGAESAVENLTTEYAPDTEARFNLPVDSVSTKNVDMDSLLPDGESATDEPFYALQWDKQALDVPDAHGTTRGEGTRVAVIDTGVAAGHPDLNNVNEALSRNLTGDQYGAPGPWGGYHGTHVAGIIGADDTNQAGVTGTAPGTEIVDCRVFSPNELASFADVVAAIVYAASVDCDAANLSLGAYPIPRQGLGPFYGKVLNRTTTYANRQGTVIVVAAGNDSADLQHDKNVISLPNEAAQALSISATGPIGFGWGDTGLEAPYESPAFYTNYGTNAIDLGAPGGDADLSAIGSGVPWYLDLVLSTIAEPAFDDDGDVTGVDYSWAWAAGTSMAAPQVSGAVALIRSEHPRYNANQVESALERAAEVPDGYDKSYYGSGFLNLVDAL